GEEWINREWQIATGHSGKNNDRSVIRLLFPAFQLVALVLKSSYNSNVHGKVIVGAWYALIGSFMHGEAAGQSLHGSRLSDIACPEKATTEEMDEWAVIKLL
ncbi:hypothetical protein Dimus_030119, partial [Dionaea muscipula]